MLEATSITLTPRSRDQDAVTKASLTPSPSAVQDFSSTTITNSNASDVVSDAIFGQLGVVVTDSEVIEYSSAVALPELTEAYEQTDFENDVNGDENDLNISEDNEANDRCSLRSRATTNVNATTPTIGQRMLQQALSSLATPISTDSEFTYQIHVGNERPVSFYAKSLGVTLNRGIDGYVRVVSATKVEDNQVRDGDIFVGDIVREVNDVDLRMPIDMAVWKMTIALMKMAPRPLRMILAEELIDHCADVDYVNAESPPTTCNVTESQIGEDKKYRSATRAFKHLMKRSSTADKNATDNNTNKGTPPTLEELSEEHLTSIELDHSRDAMDDFDECMLTAAQINNLL